MEYVHWTDRVDETKLDHTDRLALAACRLNSSQWDPILGPKPDGFDDLPKYEKPNRFTGKRKPCKYEYCIRAIEAIRSIVGKAAISRFYWINGLKKTEDEWLHWYVSEDGPF